MRIGIVPYCQNPRHVLHLWRYDVVIDFAVKAGHSAEYYRVDSDYDVVVVCMAPENIKIFRALRKKGVPIIGDITDNLLTFPFSNYSFMGDVYYRTKYFLTGRFRVFAEMLKHSHHIVTGSDYQRRVFSAYNSKITRITDAVTTETLQYQTEYKKNSPCKLVWFGNVSSLHGFRRMGDALDRLAEKGNYELVLITPDYVQGRYLGAWPRTVMEFIAEQSMPCRWVPWTYNSLLRECSLSDICILPVDYTEPFVVSKPSGRALLTMGMGLPVVAGPLESYIADIPVGAGYIAHTPADWIEYIDKLASHLELRKTVGMNARNVVIANFSAPIFAKKYLQVLESFK